VNPSQRVRRIIATILLVVGGLGVALASTGWWLERNFLDTGRFTRTADNLLDEEDTQRAITRVLVRQLSSAAGRDLELAEPFLATVVQQVVDSAPFRAIFNRALAAAHERVVDRDADQLVLDLTATYDRIKAPLEQVAPRLAEDLPSRDELKVDVLRESQLTGAWNAIDLVEDVIAIVTVAALVLLAAGLALAYERWRALALAAWTMVGTLAFVLLALVVARSVIPDRISDTDYARAAKTGFGVITHGLVVQSIVIVVLGGVLALAAGWTQRHGLAAWSGAFRRAWLRVEELLPRPADAPELEARAGATATAGEPARTGDAAHAQITGALDRVLPRGGVRAQHTGRALALLGLGLFAVLAPGGLTTVVVVLLGVGALYLALVEGVAAWRTPKPPAQEAAP
jgi:hypothetical protein